MKEIEVRQVVITSMRTRGRGIEGDPIRKVVEVYDFDGTLIADNDPVSMSGNDLVAFYQWCKKNEYNNPTLEDAGIFMFGLSENKERLNNYFTTKFK